MLHGWQRNLLLSLIRSKIAAMSWFEYFRDRTRNIDKDFEAERQRQIDANRQASLSKQQEELIRKTRAEALFHGTFSQNLQGQITTLFERINREYLGREAHTQEGSLGYSPHKVTYTATSGPGDRGGGSLKHESFTSISRRFRLDSRNPNFTFDCILVAQSDTEEGDVTACKLLVSRYYPSLRRYGMVGERGGRKVSVMSIGGQIFRVTRDEPTEIKEPTHASFMEQSYGTVNVSDLYDTVERYGCGNVYNMVHFLKSTGLK